MNASKIRKFSAIGSWRLAGIFALALFATSVGGLTGCHTTQQVGESKKEFSGFLGDYSLLQPGGKGEANYLYIDRSVNFAKYTKVYVESVGIWKSDNCRFGAGAASRRRTSSSW